MQEVKEKNTPLNELKRVHKDEAQENALVSKKEAEERQNKMSAFDLVTEDEEQKQDDVSTTIMMTKFVKKEIVLYLLKPEGSVRSAFEIYTFETLTHTHKSGTCNSSWCTYG